MPLYLYDGALLVRSGALGTEQACCCAGDAPCTCAFPLPAGMVPNISAVITFPNVAGDCPAGQYAVSFNLTEFLGGYIGSGQINLGGTIFVCIRFDLACGDGQWCGVVTVFTGRCDQNFHRCTIGNGAFIGTGAQYDLPSYVQDGVCLPSPVTFSAELDLGVVYDFTLTFS